jgi:hypothetical protein
MARRDPSGRPWINASELGSFVYCARSLQHKIDGTRVGADGQARMRAGTRAHHRHGVLYDLQRGVRRAATWLLLAAALIGALLALRAYLA